MPLTDQYFIDQCKNITAGYTPGGKKEDTFSSGVLLAGLFAHLPRDTAFLDVGSGNGRLAMGLYSLGFRNYTGLEIIPQCVSFCNKVFVNEHSFRFIHFLDANARYYDNHSKTILRYPVENASIGCVAAISLFSHLGTLATVDHHLTQIARVIEPNGFFFSTWFFGTPVADAKLSVFDRTDIEKLLAKHSFNVTGEGSLYGTEDMRQTTLTTIRENGKY